MTTQTTALVTGGNKGIGYETCRRLLGEGWQVWLGSRDEARGQAAVDALGAERLPGAVRLLSLDVTDDASVQTAAKTVDAEGGLDVLVNNAGIVGTTSPPDETSADDLLQVYGVNVVGPVRMIHAFLEILRRSTHPRIVNVSSGVGSFAWTSDPGRLESTLRGLAYPSAKAALNMLTAMYAKSLPGIQVNAVDPGYTSTDLNGRRGTQPVEVGAEPVVRAAMTGRDGPTGAFLGLDGFVPW
ncbi:MAG: SDR family NAD(P)-dependent oxidoreductase [Nocardioides sp.]|nr:SDR family NAD(P)-dependent oxidoreductase [Nocardioides sp.]